MKHELDLVSAFHEKFHHPILKAPSLIAEDRSHHRYRLMKEEVEEYLQEIEKNSLADVAKELADILYTVYGTILEHGLQDKMPDVFEEVHRSNMSKDYAEYKMVKGKDYFKADIKKFFS